MKKLTMVLPLAVLLAYCSGPNNTQTTDTETDMEATTTESSVSTATTTTSDATLANNTATTYDEISRVNQTNSGVAVAGTAATTESTQGSLSTSGVLPSDTTDPMYQHWQRTNARHWTWDMDYPGFDRPVAGTYNTAINGDWQLVMTPELASAWLPDNSRSLWLRDGSTYLSASESFNTRQNNLGVSGSATLNNNNIGVSGNTSASVSGLNNNASANTTIANQMNGGTVNSSANTTVSANTNTTGSGTVSGSAGVTGSVSGTTGSTEVTGGISGSTGTTTGVTGTTDLSGSAGMTGSTATMDVNSVNYNASNGNMYQMPKFNLYLDNGSFTGYTGCNGISGRLQVTGTSLRFLNTSPATNIDCLGGFDENILLDMLRRIDSYAYVGDELQLMQGNQVLLRFRKNGQGTSLQ